MVDVLLDNDYFNQLVVQDEKSAESWIHPLGPMNIVSYISVWTKVVERLTHLLTNGTTD